MNREDFESALMAVAKVSGDCEQRTESYYGPHVVSSEEGATLAAAIALILKHILDSAGGARE
jgi:hypothetical protein